MNLTMLLAEEQSAGGFAQSWPILLVLVLFLALMMWNMFSSKKRQKEAEKALDELKVGDKVVTNAGVYGEIVSIRHTNFGKVALIKSGEDDKVSYLSVNLSVILGKDEKHDVIVDADGNIIDPEAEKEAEESKQAEVEVKNAEQKEETPSKENEEKVVETQVKETKTEEVAEKPAKKSTAKKSSAKSTSKKSTTKKTTEDKK